MNRIKFGALRKTVTDAVTTAAHGARDLAFDAKEALDRALTAKCLRAYTVGKQIATSGPQGLWKIYTADYKNPGGFYPCVSVWILEKKLLQDALKNKNRVWDTFFDQQRTAANHLIKLKHPGILRIIEPLEETRTQFIMVTEPIFCSLYDWLSNFSGIRDIPDSVKNVTFSELEVKHGLLQAASAIGFLHNDVSLVHCALSPENVLICADGHWTVSNLAFGTHIDFTGSKTITTFDYTNSSPGLDELATKPNLEYIAPELATSRGDDMSINVSATVDVFSFGLIIYAALTKVGLLSGIQDNIGHYKTMIQSLNMNSLSSLPSQVQPFVLKMLSLSPSQRPPITAVFDATYFQNDVLLRALQFLEGMVGKDPMQKASFLRDLEQFWSQFDVRVIRYKILPPLMLELQNPMLQSLIIPFVFKASGNQSKEEFESYTLPSLRTVLESIKGDALLTVLNHCDPLTKVMTRATVAEVLLPIFLRAFDQNVPKIQEESLRKAPPIFECLDYEQLKSKVLPRLHTLSMKTASAKVRINSLVLMGHLIPRLDKDESQKMILTCRQITQVDKSQGTLMCVLGVCDSISKHWGEIITAQIVLPFLTPLLIVKTLSHQQFATYLTVTREMLNRIEEKTGKQIRESEPVTVAQTKQEEKQNVTWDTTKPKSTWNSPQDELSNWTDVTLQSKIQPSPVQTTLSNAAGAPDNFSRPPMDDFLSGMEQMAPVQPLIDIFQSSRSATIHSLPQVKSSIPMLDPMSFGMGSTMSMNKMEANGVSYLGSDDFFSGIQLGSQVQQSSDPAATTDPFLNLATSTPSQSNDPFADLLR